MDATTQAGKQGVYECEWEKKQSEPLLQTVWKARNVGIPTMIKKDWKKIWCNKTIQVWKEKTLHGQYARQAGDVTDEDRAYRWMRTTGLNMERGSNNCSTRESTKR